MAKCPWCGNNMTSIRVPYTYMVKFACLSDICPSNQIFKTESEALSAASKRFMPKRTVEEILELCEKFSILFTKTLNSFPDKKQGECPNVFSARYASFVNYVLAVQATRIADFIHGAE